MWTFCWCFIFLFVTLSLGSVYSVHFWRGTWCSNDHLDYSPKGFFWCLRICTCEFCMANDFLAQRHLLNQIWIYWIKSVCFPGPPHRRLKDILSNVQNNTVSSLPLFQLFQCSRLKKFFLTTITLWVCCTGRVGKEGGSSQYVHIVLYTRQQIFVIRLDLWKGSDGAEKLEPGLVLPRQNQKLLNARNISGKFITCMWLSFVAGQQRNNAGSMLGVPS